MQNQYGRFSDDRLINKDKQAALVDKDSLAADLTQNYDGKTPSPTNFEGCIILSVNLISLIWGLSVLEFSEIDHKSLTRLHLFFILSMSTVVTAVLSSVLLTLIFYAIGFMIRNPLRNSVFGCCPVFLFLILYVEYGIIIHEGFKMLVENKEKLDPSLTAFIIFQLAMGLIFYLLGFYHIFCDRRIISPHLTELEKDTYDIKESEIQNIRTEIQQAKQKRGVELKNLPIVIPNVSQDKARTNENP